MAEREPMSRAGDPILVVGAGQAGVQLAESLRREGHQGPLILIGNEPHPPYHRPPLSKKWMVEPAPVSTILIRSPEALQRENIELRLDTRVERIDPVARRVFLADGKALNYHQLALTTGACPRALPIPGVDLAGVHYLRDVADSRTIGEAIRRCVQNDQPLVIIGGGFIGLEIAASARKLGVRVTLLEGLPRLMSRVVSPVVSEAFRQIHQNHGVELIFDAQIEEILGEHGRVSAVRAADGREYPAGCVVVGIGVVPDDQLALEAGLECERGVVVDACGRTSDPHIVAAGDCTARRMADGTLLRLESVNNAVEQGRAAAAALMGVEKPFVSAPWFWSDQYDIKLQMTGISQGFDQVVTRGSPASLEFSAFYYREGRLIAVDSMNRPGDHMISRRLLDKGLTPTETQVIDLGFDLKELLQQD